MNALKIWLTGIGTALGALAWMLVGRRGRADSLMERQVVRTLQTRIDTNQAKVAASQAVIEEQTRKQAEIQAQKAELEAKVGVAQKMRESKAPITDITDELRKRGF